MPRAAKQAKPSLPSNTLIIDNGAYNIKAGFAPPDSSTEPSCRITPNCIARARDRRIWIGSQLEQCKDFGEMAFRRPVEKGYIVNWEGEKAIWDHEFLANDAALKCDPHDTTLVLTEAPNSPQALQTNCDQMVFEEFEFASYYRCLAPALNAYNDIPALFSDPASTSSGPVESLLVIDTGYSHTTITPLHHGRPFHSAIRRLTVGGKFLTNHLKELISLRAYNFMDETHLVNEIKEDVCFVSTDFAHDLERTWKGSSNNNKTTPDTSIVVDYVLPDYTERQRGFARPHDPSAAAKAKRLGLAQGGVQHHTASGGATSSGKTEDLLPLGNERFAVPELLFHPNDIGLPEPGLPDAVMQSLQQLPEGLWPGLLANVVVVGGNSLLPGFTERLERELRAIVPAELLVRVARPEDPVTFTWKGGVRLAGERGEGLRGVAVTREEYLENGSAWAARRFAGVV
ncbi:Actin-like protein arp6 [Lasiodiplodia theobromae]|uniref:Actin-like protein ARP6 n=1 Tax=Lasiodiplodia theobromae TaxID=45133 RepID=A0A5N5DFT2_9PEZI|nr:Actin-like protein arp6 [Lasiodiplodia theobromae]KAB2576507.1 Actin-like protein arp6 [Lasiodiplodia theobromae]KAF4546693.1 Actin-like protein arp6 [Lasiodiplodia theobromae]